MIYKNESIERYCMMVGMTKRMHNDGKTPDEIALKVKHPISEVLECIVMIKNNELRRLKNNIHKE